MRFLVDECTGPSVAKWLREQGHEVFSVYDEARGIGDVAILEKAFAENWILITNDKDFGERVFADRLPHHGVVLLRLTDERAAAKIIVVAQLIANHGERLAERFTVATETAVRISE